MTFQCTDVESRLSDYLEGVLAADEQEATRAHLAACANCRTLVEDLRAALALIRKAEEEELPPGLVTRILAQTTGRAERPGWRERARLWLRPVAEPRFALSFAMALFSVSLVINALGISLREVRPADLNPANIVRRVDRAAHLSYARSVKFVNDLRVVYEIQSRVLIAQPQAEEQQSPAPQEKPEEEKQQERRNSADQDLGVRYLACWQIIGSLKP